MALSLTRRVWKLHSWLGLICGLGLLVIGLTGSILVFRTELEGLLHPDLFRVEPGTAPRKPAGELLAAVEKSVPGYAVAGWRVSLEPSRADMAYVIQYGSSDWRFVMVNPYTGELLGKPSDFTSTITGWILELHYTFLAGHTGMFITGLLGVGLCLLGLSGFWLYRGFWKSLFTLRWKRSARIFFSDVHKMTGILSVVFNLILGFTGAYWNITHVGGHWFEEEHEEPTAAARSGPAPDVDKYLENAKAAIEGFQPAYYDIPYLPEGEVIIYGYVPTRSPIRSETGSTVTINPATNEVTAKLDIRTASAWEQVTDAFYPLHFGNFGGVIVQILWCIGGLTPAILALTGSIIWWKRSTAHRKAVENSRKKS